MSDSKYTPGPWRVTTELRDTDEIVCDMLNEKGYVAITQGQKLSHWREDAKLIAAAPDLLEALKSSVSDLFYQIESKHGAEAASKYPSIVAARAAIAKATA
jgi:hypothetical protein